MTSSYFVTKYEIHGDVNALSYMIYQPNIEYWGVYSYMLENKERERNVYFITYSKLSDVTSI